MPDRKRSAFGGHVRARLVRFAGAGLVLALCAGGLGASGGSDKMLLVGYGSSLQSSSALGAGHTVPGAGSEATTAAFSIGGHVTGLFPGATLPLTLTVTNHQTFAITVTALSTAVSNASKLCKGTNVTVTSFSGSLVIQAGKHAKTVVQVTMLPAAPNACQSASFPFQYTGTATAP